MGRTIHLSRRDRAPTVVSAAHNRVSTQAPTPVMETSSHLIADHPAAR